MTKRKPVQHLLKSCKHPETSGNNIASSYENSQSTSRSLVVKFNTSCHHFLSKLSCMMYKLLKIIVFLVSRYTTFNNLLSESWELAFSH